MLLEAGGEGERHAGHRGTRDVGGRTYAGPVAAYDLDELRGLSLARQFPEVDQVGTDAVVAAVDRIGPIQPQTARSPYVGLSARLPGLTRADVTEAFESWRILRGDTPRHGPHLHRRRPALLDATTRVGQRALWRRFPRLDHAELDDVWAAIEVYAADEWRTRRSSQTSCPPGSTATARPRP